MRVCCIEAKDIFFSSEHKKAKGVNKNVVKTISWSEGKHVLFNKNCPWIESELMKPTKFLCVALIIKYDRLALGYWIKL